MKTISSLNFHSLLADIGVRIKRAGAEGVLLKDFDAVDAYLSAIHCVEGNAAVKNTPEGARLVWLEKQAKGLTIIDEC